MLKVLGDIRHESVMKMTAKANTDAARARSPGVMGELQRDAAIRSEAVTCIMHEVLSLFDEAVIDILMGDGD